MSPQYVDFSISVLRGRIELWTEVHVPSHLRAGSAARSECMGAALVRQLAPKYQDKDYLFLVQAVIDKLFE